MNTTARTSAKTLLVAAGAAGFIAFGSGFSWADTLGGATDGLPLNDLGGQVPTLLTEGIGSPVGDLASVQPGTISAAPDVQHNSAPTGSLTDGLPVEAPLALDGNSTDVGLDTVTGALPVAAPTVPQSGALDPVTGALGGLGLLDGIGLNSGGTLPLSHPAQKPLPGTAGKVNGTVNRLGTGVGQGTHEVGTALTGLDAAEAVPMSDPVMPVNGQNTDLTGGAADIVSDLVLGEGAAALPQAGPVGVPEVSEEDLDAVTGLLPQAAPVDSLSELPGTLPVGDLGAATGTLPQAAPADRLPELPADDLGTAADLDAVTGLLPQAAAADALPGLPAVGDLTSALPATDSVGGDLVGVDGLPSVGEPTLDGGPLEALAH
ncbi:hypothetical protein SUDANB121_03051 [Nocardiopsis dassonvillei]|uniref:hypothetical protein n=1 Tax=Nocardiopsis dassonvillei TaxID=2014 RepID=UPI003F55D57F